MNIRDVVENEQNMTIDHIAADYGKSSEEFNRIKRLSLDSVLKRSADDIEIISKLNAEIERLKTENAIKDTIIEEMNSRLAMECIPQK